MKLAWIVLMLAFGTASYAQTFPTTYVGGETDIDTPAVRILGVTQLRDALQITVEVSPEYDFCPECAEVLPEGYGQSPQVPNQGHVHVYLRPVREEITDDRLATTFCAFNAFNGSTFEIAPGVWQSICGKPPRGKYLLCALAETNAHTQRVKAHPRDFPPMDCQEIKVRSRGRKK